DDLRIKPAAGQQVDLTRERFDLLVEAGNAFGGSKRVERVADLRKPALDVGELGRFRARRVTHVEAIGKRAQLRLQALEDAAWQRLAERAADLAELLAQRRDLVADRTGAAQVFDLLGDGAQLLLERRQVGARGRIRRRRSVGGRRVAVELALP